MSFIAYMDLLGIKSIAAYSTEQYYKTIEMYQSIMSRHVSDNLNKLCSNVYMFSDCAYLESAELFNLCQFLQKIRQELMLRDIFFNAAITQGTLDAVIETGNQHITSIRFASQQTVEVYNNQVSFTGIGVSVDEKIVSQHSNNEYFVKSCFNVYSTDPNQKYKIFKEYYDIKYLTDVDITLNFMLKKFIETFGLDSKAARYYLSGVSTILRSMSISELKKCKDTIFSSEIIEHSNIKSNFISIQIIYIDCYLNEIRKILDIDYNDLSNVSNKLDWLFKNSDFKKGIENLQVYPNCVLSDPNKYLLSKIFSYDYFD